MNYLKISNEGEVDPQAFTLLGASTKRGESGKIGMFGSGTKYAIAYFLRNGIDVKVFAGENEISINKVKKDFREQSFEVILIDGKETSITTSSGPKWKLWQAIREIYSNAIDEGLIELTETKDLNCEPGTTNFYIEMNLDVQDFYENVDKYFATDKKVLYENEFGKIYEKRNQETLIYRKGIKCYDTTVNSIFDYDFEKISINESRIINDTDDIYTNISRLLYPCTDENVIRNIYDNINENFIEKNLNSSLCSTDSKTMSNAWLTQLKTKYIAPVGLIIFLEDHDAAQCTFVPDKIYYDFVAKFGNDYKPPALNNKSGKNFYKPACVTKLQVEILKQVLAFFNAVSFDFNYSIDVVVFDNPKVHARIEGDKVLINQVAFEQGKKWIANILIEEYIHIKYNARDKSREFQDAVINEFLTYMQEANTIVL